MRRRLIFLFVFTLLHQAVSAEIFTRKTNPPGFLNWHQVLSYSVEKSEHDEVFFMLSVDENLNVVNDVGEVLWQREVRKGKDVGYQLPLVATRKRGGGKVAFVWGKKGILYALDLKTGDELWNSGEVVENFPTLEETFDLDARRYVEGDFVYYVTDAGSVKRVNLADFSINTVYQPLTSKKTKNLFTSPPFVYYSPGIGKPPIVWVGTRDGYVEGIDLDSRRLLYTYPKTNLAYKGKRKDHEAPVRAIPILPSNQVLYFARTVSNEVQVFKVRNPISGVSSEPVQIKERLSGELSQFPQKTSDGYVLFTSVDGDILVLDKNGNVVFSSRKQGKKQGENLKTMVWEEGVRKYLILASDLESTGAAKDFQRTNVRMLDFGKLVGRGTPNPTPLDGKLFGQTMLPFQADLQNSRFSICTVVSVPGERQRNKNIASLLNSLSVKSNHIKTSSSPIINRRVDAVGLQQFQRFSEGEEIEILLAPSDSYLATAINVVNGNFIGALGARKRKIDLKEENFRSNATYVFKCGSNFFVASGNELKRLDWYSSAPAPTFQTDFIEVEPGVDEEDKICYLPVSRNLIAVSLEEGSKFLRELGRRGIEVTPDKKEVTRITTKPMLNKRRGEIYLTDSAGFVQIFTVEQTGKSVSFKKLKWVIDTNRKQKDGAGDIRASGIFAQPFFDDRKNTLYVGTAEGVVCALELNNLPKNRQSLNLGSPGVSEIFVDGAVSTPLIVEEDTLYFGINPLNKRGKIMAVELGGRFNETKPKDVYSSVRGSLSNTILFKEDKIYVAAGKTMFAFDTKAIKDIESVHAFSQPIPPPVAV